MTATRILTATALAFLASAAPAAAYTPPKAKRMTLAVDVTGIHVVDWHVQDGAYPDPARSWSEGSGTQTLGFSTRRPIRFRATALSGTTPRGDALPPLILAPMRAPAPLKGSLRRTASWKVNDGSGCDREGGCDDDPVFIPLHAPASCPGKQVAVPAEVDVTAPAGEPQRRVLYALIRPAKLDGLWPNCPPDMDAIRRPLRLAQPPSLGFADGIRRISRLRRGGKVTLKAQLEQGAAGGAPTASCPPLTGPGQQECAVTDITVEVRRLR
jgi:hypothetical protein